MKDPATGKRMGRLDDEREWVVEEVPELRIIENELWDAVKERQEVVREKLLTKDSGIRAECARRPAYLFSACFGAASAVVVSLNAVSITMDARMPTIAELVRTC